MARYKYSENTKEVTDVYFDTETHGEYMGMEQGGEMKHIKGPTLKSAIEDVAKDVAEEGAYDNTDSGLAATVIKGAIDEVAGEIATLNADDTTEGSVAKTVKDAVADLAGTGRTTETVKGNADAIALRELSANKVVAFQETPDDTHYPSEKLVDDSLEAIKGVGYTEGTLKSHEDRLDTLEGTGEGSVAKTVKDNAKDADYDGSTSGLTAETLGGAIDELDGKIDTLEGRVDSTELTLARQGQDLASVKQTIQQGNGATLDFTGIGSVALDARATGRANPTVDGRTATNLVIDGSGNSTTGWSAINATLSSVSGWLRALKTGGYHGMATQLPVSKGKLLIAVTLRADEEYSFTIAIQRYVSSTGTFVILGYRLATLLGSTYYGIVDTTAWAESTMWLRIQDANNNFTGTYVEAKDVIVADLTSIYGAGNEPSATDCAKIFSYFDGTKSISMPARVRSVSEDELETSTIYIADNNELRSVPAIADEVKVVNGQLVKVQNVQRYVLQSADITEMLVKTTVTGAVVQLPSDMVNSDIGGSPPKLVITGIPHGGYTHSDMDSITYIGTWGGYYSASRMIYIVFALGTTLAEARADLAGTVIYYQLATPIITPLLTSGILQAKPNGTVYFESYYEGSHQTDVSSQIALPYTGTIEAVYGYDEDLVEYILDSSEYSLTGTTLTITGALENEVFFVQMSRSEPLAPEMTINTLNNEQVIADTSNGKYYKLVPTITNGVLVGQTPVEVV